MINITDEVMILEQNEDKLIKELRLSLLEVRNLLIADYKIKELPSKLESHNKNLSFIYHFSEEKIKNLLLTRDFISKAVEFTEEKDKNNICVEYGFAPTNIIIQNFFLRIGIKLLLLSLWKKGVILLPIRFTTGTGISQEFLKNFDTPIMQHFRGYFDKKDKNKYSEEFTLIFIPQVLRVLKATDYNNLADISIEELSNLHIQIIDSHAGRTNTKIPKQSFYIEYLLLEAKECLPNFNFDSKEYKSWYSGYSNRYDKFNFTEYQSKREDLKEYRRKYNLQDTKLRLKKKSLQNPVLDSSHLTQEDFENNLLAEEISLEEEFFKVVKTAKSWFKQVPIYSGHEDWNLIEDSKIWRQVNTSFILERQKNGYETTKSQQTTFNFLMDYIFFYLNNWKFKHSNNELILPLSPKDFKRTVYVKNVSVKDDDRPMTIIELLEFKNKPNDVKNMILRNLDMLFKHIMDYYEEEDTIWDRELKSPIRDGDFYIEKNHKKTNKIIIPKKTYSNLKKYLFALENFGEVILNQILSGREFPSIKSVINEKIINCEDYGYIPFINIDGKNIPIHKVPNIYDWQMRTFNANQLLSNNTEENIVTKWIPSVTLIRAYILTLNTGLRSAQVLWLDIRNWDILNDAQKQQAYYKLNVNTDKFKNEDWTSYISHNVRQTLLKETNFQKSMRESFMEVECNYKGRDFTRFSNILTLFRGTSKDGKSINYERYNDNWKEMLLAFQNLINSFSDLKIQLVELIKAPNNNILGGENKYCPLAIKAIHTPHSMRATFCTHMAEYLERGEIAKLVGHASDLVTSDVYVKPEDQTLIDKIAKATDMLDNGVNSSYFEKNNVSHIKPNLIGSSLQQAFKQNKDQTIELFNITSISLNINKESEEQSQKAINLLKEARMDQIIFETTHICPVGGNCPQEVMNIIVEKRRCGLCPLALKCIDNLNPIYAKQRDLIREIKLGKDDLDKAIEMKDSEITLHKIEEKVNLDIQELVSWKFSAEILSNHYEKMKADKNLEKTYYVEMPDMVKNHLTKVSVATEKEYLLTRLADANSYPQFDNPENRYRADILRRDIIKNLKLIEYKDFYVDEQQKIEAFCAMIKNMLDSNQINLQQLVQYDCFKSIEKYNQKQPKLLANQKILLLKQE